MIVIAIVLAHVVGNAYRFVTIEKKILETSVTVGELELAVFWLWILVDFLFWGTFSVDQTTAVAVTRWGKLIEVYYEPGLKIGKLMYPPFIDKAEAPEGLQSRTQELYLKADGTREDVNFKDATAPVVGSFYPMVGVSKTTKELIEALENGRFATDPATGEKFAVRPDGTKVLRTQDDEVDNMAKDVKQFIWDTEEPETRALRAIEHLLRGVFGQAKIEHVRGNYEWVARAVMTGIVPDDATLVLPEEVNDPMDAVQVAAAQAAADAANARLRKKLQQEILETYKTLAQFGMQIDPDGGLKIAEIQMPERLRKAREEAYAAEMEKKAAYARADAKSIESVKFIENVHALVQKSGGQLTYEEGANKLLSQRAMELIPSVDTINMVSSDVKGVLTMLGGSKVEMPKAQGQGGGRGRQGRQNRQPGGGQPPAGQNPGQGQGGNQP